MNEELSALPIDLSSKSISNREIVLPLEDALRAVDILEIAGFHILGWEGFVKCADGRVGHGSAGKYSSVSLHEQTPQESACITRQGMKEDATSWEIENAGTTDLLYFCITAQSRSKL